MKTTRVFIHGLESTSRGTKGEFFRGRYPDMILEDYAGPLAQRMDQLNGTLLMETDLILVGSSYGGLMAALYAFSHEGRVRRLILLAPALHLAEFEPCLNRPIRIPVHLYHGRQDDVVPPAPVHAIAAKVFPNLSHHPVDDDHSLHRTFGGMDWDALLKP